MRNRIHIITILLVGVLSLVADVLALPDNFDVAVRREDTYILKNGSRWNWENEKNAEFMEDWWSQFWQKPMIFSFRNGKVIMKRSTRIDFPHHTAEYSGYYDYKDVIQGIFNRGSFNGTSTTYLEIYTKHSNEKYQMPSGMYYKGWYGGRVHGETGSEGVLVLKNSFDWNRGLHRGWDQIKDADGRHKGYRFGQWKQIPHYEDSDTYALVMRLKLPKSFSAADLVDQPGFVVEDPNEALKGVPVDETAATAGGFGASQSPPTSGGSTSEQPKGKIQTGDVVFASGAEDDFARIEKSDRSRSDDDESDVPEDDPWEEKTEAEKAASAAGAAAAGSAAAAAGAAALLGASGMKKEDVVEALKEIVGKSDKKAGSSGGDVPELDAFEQQEKELNAKGWFYDDERGAFIPGKGAVNDKGQVWAEDPYEPGSVRFIDKEELDFHAQQKASGQVFVKNGSMAGWHTQGDIDQQNAHDAYVDSDEFKAKQEELFKKMDKEKAADQLKNNKAYQDWKKSYGKHTEMTKDVIKEDMEFETKSAEKWNERADKLGKISDGINTIKKGADETINVLATVTGPVGNAVKYGYNSISETAGSIATDGDVVKGVGKGFVKLGKDVTGDYVGNKIKLPGGAPSDMGSKSISDAVANTMTKKGGKEIGRVTGEVVKGKIIGGKIDDDMRPMETKVFGSDSSDNSDSVKYDKYGADDEDVVDLIEDTNDDADYNSEPEDDWSSDDSDADDDSADQDDRDYESDKDENEDDWNDSADKDDDSDDGDNDSDDDDDDDDDDW